MALLIVATFLHGALIYGEEIERPRPPEPVETDARVVAQLDYNRGTRVTNFLEYGMDQELAEITASEVDRLGNGAARLRKGIEAASDLAGIALCTTDPPPPYAALALLVMEDRGQRQVIDATTVLEFEHQDWFDESAVPQLFEEFEGRGRRDGATLMAVSAVLLGREQDALRRTAPWSESRTAPWGFQRLEAQEPRVRGLVVEYFAFMHLVAELANAPNGICRRPSADPP